MLQSLQTDKLRQNYFIFSGNETQTLQKQRFVELVMNLITLKPGPQGSPGLLEGVLGGVQAK